MFRAKGMRINSVFLRLYMDLQTWITLTTVNPLDFYFMVLSLYICQLRRCAVSHLS
jgi:hypothetical protein